MREMEQTIADLVLRIDRQVPGKYRGLVVDNNDPEQLGRIKAQVPSVLGDEVVTGWALPCVPYGGMENQGFFAIPDIGAGVWIEFEACDVEFPIWSGTYWSKPGGVSEVPAAVEADGSDADTAPVTRTILKTASGHTIQFEDAEGDEMVIIHEAGNGNTITMDGDGVKVVDGANGQEIIMDSSGVSVTDVNGNEIVMASGGIAVGSGSASEHFVHGDMLQINVDVLLNLISTHTHLGNMGAPTGPPLTAPFTLDVPVSTKHTVG